MHPDSWTLPAIFRAHGVRVSRCPWSVLFIGIFISLALALKLLFWPFVVDTDPDLIWVPPGDDTSLQKTYFDAVFDPFFRVSQVIFTLTAPGAEGPPGDPDSSLGILQARFFPPVVELQQALFDSEATDGTKLDDVCFRLQPGSPCLVQTPLDYLPPGNLSTVGDFPSAWLQDFLSCRYPTSNWSDSWTDPNWVPCLKNGVPVIKNVTLGVSQAVPNRIISICGDPVISTRALVITLLLDATPEKADAAAAWERDVFIPKAANFSAPGLTASYMAQRSISDQLVVVDNQNKDVVVVSYVAMLLYVAVSLGKFPHVIASRSLLGLLGILIVVASVLAALSLASLFGEHVTMIVVEVVPFLILAIGVDNMFILTRAVDRRWWGPLGGSARAAPVGTGGSMPPPALSYDELHDSSVLVGVDVETAVAEAMAEVGPTMAAAAACEVVAFIVGITMDVPALTQFCIVAAIAVFWDFVLQITCFTAALVLDMRRMEARRMDMAPCCVVRGPGVGATGCALRACCAHAAPGDRSPASVRARLSASGAAALLLPPEFAAKGPRAPGASPPRSPARPRGGAPPPAPGANEVPPWTGRGTGIDVGLERGYARAGPWQDPARYAMAKRDAEAAGREWEPPSLERTPRGTFAPEGDPGAPAGGGGGGRPAVPSLPLPTAGGAPSAPGDFLAFPLFALSPRGDDNLPDADGEPLYAAFGSGEDHLIPETKPAEIVRTMEKVGLLKPSTSFESLSSLNSDGGDDGKRPPPSLPRFWYAVNRGNFVRRFMSRVYAPFILHPVSRCVVLLAWAASLTLAAFGIGVPALGFPGLQLGLEQQLVLPTGSYLAPYFDALAHQGAAGPPAYLVLQDVNYTHPRAFPAITDFANNIAKRASKVLVPPVYSWVTDFQAYLVNAPNVKDINGQLMCMDPNATSASTLAHNLSFFVYSGMTRVDAKCCQQHAFCGGQYATDVTFLWGVPKAPSGGGLWGIGGGGGEGGDGGVRGGSAPPSEEGALLVLNGDADAVVEGAAPVALTRVGWSTSIVMEPVLTVASRSRVSLPGDGGGGARRELDVDDGGCDLAAGYVSHTALRAALRAEGRAGVPEGPSLSLSAAAAAAARFPPRLAAALAAPAPPELIACHVMTTRLRTQHLPLRNQSDFIAAKQVMQSVVAGLQGGLPRVTDFSLLGLPPPRPPERGTPGAATDNQHTAWPAAAPGDGAFPYSLIYVYYAQYDIIRGVALSQGLIAVGAVFFACMMVSSLAVALTTLLLSTSVTLSIFGWVWALNPHGVADPFGGGPYGVDMNAVFVVNLMTATGLSVEFIVHLAAAFLENVRSAAERRHRKGLGDARPAGAVHRCVNCLRGGNALPAQVREAQARAALIEMGSSVVTGITLTKLVGVTILAVAPSQLFRLYYFRA